MKKIRLLNKLVSAKNNNSKPALNKNDSNKSVLRKNNGNIKVNKCHISSNSVEYDKMSKELKILKLIKSKKSKID